VITFGYVTKMVVIPFNLPYSKSHAALKPDGSICYRIGVIGDRSLHFRNSHLDFFGSCDLELDPMTFIYELDPYCPETYRMCQYELPTLTLSKVII